MYPNLSFNESTAALNDWYKLFLVPGAAHCAPNPDQPNGPFPQTNLTILIDFVEKGVEPITLNATVLQGEQIGKNEQMSALLASREFEFHLRVAESHLDCARRVFSLDLEGQRTHCFSDSVHKYTTAFYVWTFSVDFNGTSLVPVETLPQGPPLIMTQIDA
jgi:hypothetical protein